MKTYAVENAVCKTPLEKVHIKGYAEDLMNIFFEKRIFSDHGVHDVLGEAETAFAECRDDEGVAGLWKGEFWGKWIISAVRVCRYTGSEKLKNTVHNSALKLIGYQREDGYIGTYKNSKNFMAADPEKTREVMGWPCNWNWNIWCRKYTLWGLLECYELTEDERILNASIGLANHLISELTEEGVYINDTGTFNGAPSCSILKPMLVLYRITEDERYLKFCLDFVSLWENADKKPGLIENSLSKKPLGDWYDFSEEWSKVYEILSCYDGLAELYRITGEHKYLEACENFYELLIKNELNAVFSVGFNDQFRDAAFNVNTITEPCDVIHWMRLCHELFALTGEAKYMDSFELAFYNPFLASSFKDGMWGARGVRGHSRHFSVNGQAGMKHNHCCVNNMPRGYMNMAESCVMESGDSLYINLYNEAEITTAKGIKVDFAGDYMANSKSQITVDFGTHTPCPIKLRIPAWSKNNKVVAQGKVYTPDSGYFTLMPENAKTIIDVEFDNEIEIIPVDAHKELPHDSWKVVRWSNTYDATGSPEDMFLYDKRFILRKGAVLLCRTKLIGSSEEEMFGTDALIDDTYRCSYRVTKPDKDVNIQLDVVLDNGSNVIKTKVCDFASGTNMIVDDVKFFSIYF